jgi:hypothetical protein
VVRLASITELLEAPRRKGDRDSQPIEADPRALAALDGSTRSLLRRLAVRSLEVLGVRETDKFVDAEMLSKFNALASGVPPGIAGEVRLRDAIKAALEQLDE